MKKKANDENSKSFTNIQHKRIQKMSYFRTLKIFLRNKFHFETFLERSLPAYIKKDSSLFLLKRYDCLANLLCLSWYWPFVTFHRFTIHFAVGNIWYVESSSALNYAQCNLCQDHALLNDVKFLIQTAKNKTHFFKERVASGLHSDSIM